MAFGLGDLADWIRDLIDEGSNAVNVVKGDAPLTNIQSVNRNVKQGIIDPGKMLAEFSGLAQGYRGAKPNASNMDKSLALLSLAGVLGGQEAAMSLKALAQPKYVYGLHISPKAGLKQIAATPEMARYYDDVAGHNYFFETKKLNEKVIREMEKYLNYNINNRTGVPGVSVYQTKTPRKGVRFDKNINPEELLDSAKPKMPNNPKKAIPIIENSLNWSTRNPEMPSIADFAIQDRGARNTPNPLEVLNEFRIGRNFPAVPGEDVPFSGEFVWKREDFVNALKSINKKQPRSNRYNKKWIDYKDKEYQKWWDSLDEDYKQVFEEQKQLEKEFLASKNKSIPNQNDIKAMEKMVKPSGKRPVSKPKNK